jgi:hydroxymethylbilane synthase
VAVEIRADDARAGDAVSPANDAAAARALTTERAIVAALGGGCQLPLGAIAEHAGDRLVARAVVASPDGRLVVRREAAGTFEDPAALGARLAAELTSGGAAAILDVVRSGTTT